MAVTICTGMWGPAAASYGAGFFSTMAAMAPAELSFVVLTEAVPPAAPAAFDVRPMDCPGWAEFCERHGADPLKNGRSPAPGWKPSAVRAGYNFRFDAVRFAGQAFVPEAVAASLPDGDVLVWLDADVIAHKPIPPGFFESLLDDADGAFLGRGRKHSEIGFWAVRLGPATRRFLTAFAELYRSDELFRLKEWHSAFAWDHARRQAEVAFRDLTPGGTGHVWFQSPLGAYLDHLKGARKALGRSMERRT